MTFSILGVAAGMLALGCISAVWDLQSPVAILLIAPILGFGVVGAILWTAYRVNRRRPDCSISGADLRTSETDDGPEVHRRAVLSLAVAGLGAAGVGASATSSAAPQAPEFGGRVSAGEFGAVGDGSTDDTAALQNWLNHLVTQGKQGWLPNGDYKISQTLTISSGYGWGIHGENQNFSQITQHTDNIPVLQIGTTGGEPSHTHIVENLMLRFAQKQPPSNTNANCLVFEGRAGDSSTYWSTYRSIYFSRGFYAMKVPEGMNVPWACEFDMLMMSEMSGGFYDNSGANPMGAPNNKWGRVTMYCDDSVGPIFNKWNTWSSTVGALEFLRAYKGPQLITTHPPFSADIGAIRLEVGTYTPADTMRLVELSGDHFVRLGVFDIGGTPSVFAPTSEGSIVAIATYSPNTTSYLEVSSMVMLGEVISGKCVAIDGGSLPNKRISIGNVRLSDGWSLQDTSGTLTGNFVKVDSWVNGALSDDIGDADYAVVLGHPNLVYFGSPFSAPRRITLPTPRSNDLCAGLYYEFIFSGAINGLNVATIVDESNNPIRVQAVDNSRVRYQWRRGAGGGAWILVDSTNLIV